MPKKKTHSSHKESKAHFKPVTSVSRHSKWTLKLKYQMTCCFNQQDRNDKKIVDHIYTSAMAKLKAEMCHCDSHISLYVLYIIIMIYIASGGALFSLRFIFLIHLHSSLSSLVHKPRLKSDCSNCEYTLLSRCRKGYAHQIRTNTRISFAKCNI